MPLTLVDEPENEPIELDVAKQQCRIVAEATDEHEYLGEHVIPAARERAEIATRRQLLTATWELKLACFPCGSIIELPKPPLLTVVYVKYVDTNGVLQTLVADTDYVVDAPAGPRCARGRIALAYGKSWPSTRAEMNAVRIQFTCGYGADGSFVPPLLKKAMLRDVATLFEHREDVITGTIVQEVPRSAQVIYRSYRSVPMYPLPGTAAF